MEKKSEGQKKNSGKITTNENQEKSKVDFQVYKKYQKYTGGWTQFILVNLVLVCFTLVKVSSEYLVGHWATAEDQHTNFNWYCIVYFITVFLQSAFVYLTVYILSYYSFYGTEKLHSDMIDRVLKAPINLYFDVTPIGRILNKFSKDLNVIENPLRSEIGNTYAYLYNLVSIFAVAVYTVPRIITIIPILLFVLILLYKSSIDASKEMARIESVTKSPLLSYLSETINGNQTIRAFQKER